MVSGADLFLGLFNNLAIFIILVAAYGWMVGRFEDSSAVKRQVAIGLCFGVGAICSMLVRIPVAEGVIVDQRNAVIALSGAFGGPLAAVLCAAIAGIFRVYLGGAGVPAGIVGVSLAAGAGIGLHFLRRRIDTIQKLAIAVFVATLIILPGFLVFGDLLTGWNLLKAMAVPYGSAVYIGIFVVGLLLHREETRRTSQVRLGESEKRFRNLYERLIDISYTTDGDGNIVAISPAVEPILGYAPDQVIGRPLSSFYWDPQGHDQLLEVLKERGRVENLEGRIRHNDGGFTWMSTNARLLREANGKISGMEGIARDISKLKAAQEEKYRLEENLRQSQKMEAIGTLAGGIAHDFNNILAAMLGYTELVRDGLEEGSEDRERLDIVLSAISRARDLTEQILLFSRKGQPTKITVQFHRVVAEAVRMLRETIPASVEIREDIDPETGFILANATQMHQVVINLCTNALQSLADETGEIGIRVEAMSVAGGVAGTEVHLQDGGYALLTVTDTGAGMEPAEATRVFEPYFTTKDTAGGTGLGLSVVHGIVTDHGGAITVESVPGKGSTFRVYLPLSDVGERESPEPPAAGRHGSERILFVDDEESLVALGRATLERYGYRVFAAISAREAISEFRADPDGFDLIITDQTMPEMTGDALAREAMQIRPGIPVIICTGHSGIMDGEKAQAMGLRAFLMKPVSPRNLTETVRAVLDRSE